ncbi:MAG: MerR family DNA-binding protein [Rhodospirillaceae bacterium]
MLKSATDITIGTVAREADVGVETVRFYERKGLIKRPRRPSNGGFRAYPTDVIERIRFIRQAQELGFSLREIEELLSLQADPATDCADVRERAQTKRDEVKIKIAQLRKIQKALDTLIAACPGKGPTRSCSILEAFEQPKKRKKSPIKKRR